MKATITHTYLLSQHQLALNLTILIYLQYSYTEPTICASLYFSLLGITSNILFLLYLE